MFTGVNMRKVLLALAGFLAFSMSASAETVTFDGYSDLGERVSSGRFSYDTSVPYGRPGVVYLHDDGGVTRTRIRTSPRTQFTPISIDVLAINRIQITGYKSPPELFTEEHDAWTRFRKYPAKMFYLMGFRDGKRVAKMMISETDDWTTIKFGAEFRNIDGLVARIAIPSTATLYASTDTLGANEKWCEEWCADMFLDDMVIAAPVPASMLTLGSAVIGLAGFAMVRRRKQADA